jgi:DNA-directed RNA polymerase subunit RPC12/RpoP
MVEKDSSPTQKAGQVKDARGQPVTLLDPYALNLLRRHDVIPAEALASIADKVGFGLPRWQRRAYFALVMIVLGNGVFLLIWKAIRRSGFDALGCILGSLGVAAFAISAIMFWRGGRQARAKLVCAIMLKHLRCPHCGYDIRGLPANTEDGATVCPECGSAWRLADSRAVAEHGDG